MGKIHKEKTRIKFKRGRKPQANSCEVQRQSGREQMQAGESIEF